jgi:FkbM family methyltransferase
MNLLNKIILRLKKIIHILLKNFNLRIVKYKYYEDLTKSQTSSFDIKFLSTLVNSSKINDVIRYLEKSKADLRQDLFVLNELHFKKEGFFVEFGACDGIVSSNTYLLEKEFKWKGILCEPAKLFEQDLKKNRKCHIDTKLVWKESEKELTFNETTEHPRLSTIQIFSNTDQWYLERRNGKEYNVETISLNDLLKKFNAPKIIDYLSIDTEGSEFDILNNFNFENYSFKIITCEHNNTANREKIFNLLKKYGYIRKYSEITQCDDWYMNSLII